jgi:hypothetical protein
MMCRSLLSASAASVANAAPADIPPDIMASVANRATLEHIL